MSKGNNTENNILKLIFNATTWADMAENDTTGPSANLTVALHTADPGEEQEEEDIMHGHAYDWIRSSCV